MSAPDQAGGVPVQDRREAAAEVADWLACYLAEVRQVYDIRRSACDDALLAVLSDVLLNAQRQARTYADLVRTQPHRWVP